jgi:hypothetical protein
VTDKESPRDASRRGLWLAWLVAFVVLVAVMLLLGLLFQPAHT